MSTQSLSFTVSSSSGSSSNSTLLSVEASSSSIHQLAAFSAGVPVCLCVGRCVSVCVCVCVCVYVFNSIFKLFKWSWTQSDENVKVAKSSQPYPESSGLVEKTSAHRCELSIQSCELHTLSLSSLLMVS